MKRTPTLPFVIHVFDYVLPVQKKKLSGSET